MGLFLMGLFLTGTIPFFYPFSSAHLSEFAKQSVLLCEQQFKLESSREYESQSYFAF